MLVSIQSGRGDSYCATFIGKGPFEDLYTAAMVLGDKVVSREVVGRDLVSHMVRVFKHDPRFTVELHKTAGVTMRV